MKKKIGSRQILLLILLLIAAVIPVFVRTPYLLSICVMTFYMASVPGLEYPGRADRPDFPGTCLLYGAGRIYVHSFAG